jgi:hypothetical protein
VLAVVTDGDVCGSSVARGAGRTTLKLSNATPTGVLLTFVAAYVLTPTNPAA